MNERLARAAERSEERSAMAKQLVYVCERGGAKISQFDGRSVFVVENAAGTQYTVTVARRRYQE